MLRFLFVDDQLHDDSSSASIAARKLEETGKYDIVRADFADAEQKIKDVAPDLVILDLQEESESGDQSFAGNNTCEWIWENRFCPIVVYSAFPDEFPEAHKDHPFVEIVKKGMKGVEHLKESIDRLKPHIESIREAERSIRKEFSVAMREIAPYAFKAFSDSEQRKETIKRSGRRRLAALMDGLSSDGIKLSSWEQYLYPPVCSDIQLGDIIRKADGDVDDPNSFRVVLTPSCDLVASGGRKPKVDNVLVACCYSMKDGLDYTSLKGMGISKLKDRLPGTVLTQGYFESIIPFPGLEGKIPAMTANLRRLEFVPIEEIGLSGKTFLRIASIDSPFRELVSWAYLHVACRPGLPDRDFESWCNEIVSLLQEEKGKGGG